MKTIAIIGSTGSIGTTSLKVIKKYKKFFQLEFLYANKNYKALNLQLKKFKPRFIYLADKRYLSKLNTIKILSIKNFLKKKKKIDYIISAVSGYSCLELNFKLLKICKNLLIANKETIICGGNIFLNRAKKNKCNIIPIDSEHYCINYFLKNFVQKDRIDNFYLTASGGPFLKKKPKNNIDIKKVLKHPNWSMGIKNTVNSANLTNKILELFEAHFLFKIPPNRLNIKIEKSSKIHSVISLNNGLDFMISHNTTMEIPIKNSLLLNHHDHELKKNLMKLNKLNFEILNPNKKIFPIIDTGYQVLNCGHRAMIIFTILNDRLVEMFLKKEISFNDISIKLIDYFKKNKILNYFKIDIKSIKDIKETIHFAKEIKL